jgi:hypothetical protein
MVPTALRWSSDDDDWVVLAFDDIDGRTPELPWIATELERVLDALHALADAPTPSPIPLESASDAPWLDLVAMLPSIAMQGGPDPDAVWCGHPLNQGVDHDRVDAFIAALTGMLVYRSRQPPAPGIPTLRSFQAAQGTRAMAWLARRRGWT